MRYFLLLLGIILSSIGLTYIIIYLNLLLIGFSFIDYLEYVFTKIECLLFFVGYILLIILIKKGNKKWYMFMI